jgi:hypothetical protein
MLNHDDLNVLINGWEEGTLGHEEQRQAIAALDILGKRLGYGALAQIAQWLYEVQCHDDPKKAIFMKRERFHSLGWNLPERFEEVAAK